MVGEEEVGTEWDMVCGWQGMRRLGTGCLRPAFKTDQGSEVQLPTLSYGFGSGLLGCGPVGIMFLALDSLVSLWSGLGCAAAVFGPLGCGVFLVGLPSAGACMASSSSLSKSKA